jgi:hypothetical protein
VPYTKSRTTRSPEVHGVPKYTESRTTRSTRNPEGHEVDCLAEFKPCSLKTMKNMIDKWSPGSANSRNLRRIYYAAISRASLGPPRGPMRLNVDSEQTFLFFRTPRKSDSFFIQQLTSAKKIAVTIHLCRATPIKSGKSRFFWAESIWPCHNQERCMARIAFVLFVLVTCAYAQPHPVCGDTCGSGTQPRGSGVQTQTFLFFRRWTRSLGLLLGRGGRERSGSSQSATDPLHPNSSEINVPSGVAE